MSERAKPRWFGILRALLAVVPLAWIFTKLDGPRLLERLGDLSWWVLGVSVVAPLLAMGIASLRWRVLLGGYGANSPPRVRTLFRHVLVGAYFNLLPGAVAGDALRAFRTKGAVGGTVDSFTVVFVERLAGLVGLILLGLLGLAVADVSGTSWLVDALLWGSVVALLALLVAMFGPGFLRRLLSSRVLPADGAPSSDTLTARLVSRAADWAARVPPPRSRSSLVWAVLLSLFTQGVTVLQNLLLLSVLAPDVPVSILLPLLPLVVFLTYFPITPAAVGQREVVYVQVLGQVGVGAEAGVSTSILVFASLLVAAGFGGVLYLLEGPERGVSVPPKGTPSWFPPSNSPSAP